MEVYIVKNGDTLSAISQYFYGTMTLYPQLAELNKIHDPNKINVGDKIKIPDKLLSVAKKEYSNSQLTLHLIEHPKKAANSGLGVGKATIKNIKAPASMMLGSPAEFRVSKIDGAVTDELKKKIIWKMTESGKTEDLIKKHASVIKKDSDKLIIEAVPLEWKGKTIVIAAAMDEKDGGAVVSVTPTSCTLVDWILLIQKTESEYPELNGVAMTNAMRRIAGYDNTHFRTMFAGSPQGSALAPKGALTQSDLDALQVFTRHEVSGGVEAGIITDQLGYQLAAGHVLTGISGGVYRNRSIDVTPSHSLAAGERMDNLYAVTISGDLGQVAVLVNEEKQAKPYIGGLHTDATSAELVGDIDGFILGNTEPVGGSGKKLSETLVEYYCSSTNIKRVRSRFDAFNQVGMANVLDQTKRFGSTYKYASEGAIDGLFSEVETECIEACAEFTAWLNVRLAKEKMRNK